MKTLIAALLLSTPAFAAETCYQITLVANLWSKTPETLCIQEKGKQYAITLKSGQNIVANFNFDLLQRTKCINCNDDVFGVANPSNSTFNDLAIKFSGYTTDKHEEIGNLSIGDNQFFYRRIKLP